MHGEGAMFKLGMPSGIQRWHRSQKSTISRPHICYRGTGLPIKDAPIWPQDSPLAAPSHPFPDIAPIGSHPLLSAGFDLCLLHHPLESKRYV